MVKMDDFAICCTRTPMLVINCPSCPHVIVLQSAVDRPPPWCPRCGGDLKPRAVPKLPDEARKLWNEKPAPTAAVATAPSPADSLQAETPDPPVHVPASPRREPYV